MMATAWLSYRPVFYRSGTGWMHGKVTKVHAVIARTDSTHTFACGKVVLDQDMCESDEMRTPEQAREDWIGYGWSGIDRRLVRDYCAGCCRKTGVELKIKVDRSASGRDHQRKKLYRAEWMNASAQGRGMRGMGVEDAQVYADALIGSDWFKATYPEVQRNVRIIRGRKCASGGGWYRDHGATISLTSTDEYTLVHEIAHHVHAAVRKNRELQDATSHGGSYATLLLDLVEHTMGREYARNLEACFDELKVTKEWVPAAEYVRQPVAASQALDAN